MPRYPASPERIAERDSIAGWQDRVLIPVKHAAYVSGVSTASIYDMLHSGSLLGAKLAGRTLVRVTSLQKLLAEAPAFVSSGPRGVAAKRASTASIAA